MGKEKLIRVVYSDVEEEAEYLNPRRKNPIRKKPRIKKKIVMSEVSRSVITKKLPIAMFLFPMVRDILNQFNLSSGALVLFLNLKYLKRATVAEIMKTQYMTKLVVNKYLKRLIDAGFVEVFRIEGGRRGYNCYALTLKGQTAVKKFEIRIGIIMRSVDLTKLNSFKYDEAE